MSHGLSWHSRKNIDTEGLRRDDSRLADLLFSWIIAVMSLLTNEVIFNGNN